MHQLEGTQSVLAALRARQRRFEVILIKHGSHAEDLDQVVSLAAELNTPIRYVESREIEAMANGSSHGGVLAVVSARTRLSIAALVDHLDCLAAAPLLMLLEGVDDARNLGFVLRTAEAMGVHGVLIKKHLWDFEEAEVARPSSGAFERLPLVQIDSVEPLIALQKRGLKLYGCLAAAKHSMADRDLSAPTILALGGEKRGLSGAVRSICDGLMTIPTVGGASSLSLSHAAAILCAEAARQRRGGGETTN